MKKLLSLLLVFVFLQTQVWALSGGPDYGSNDSGVTIGTFAGVLTPEEDDTTPITTSGSDASNALGVFSVGIPETGIAQGVFAYFESGKTYLGTIVGVADPQKLRLRALVKSQYEVSEQVLLTSTGTTATSATPATVTTVTGQANGSLDAKIRSSGSTAIFGVSAIRLQGDATLDVQSINPATGTASGEITTLKLAIDGFKSSTTADTTVSLDALSSTSTTSG